MALPTLAKTWQFGSGGSPLAYINQAIAASGTQLTTNRNMLFALINSFLGMATLPAQVRGSANGTGTATACIALGAAGPATNNIIAATNLVWANAGSNHSWIVLRFTGVNTTYFELLISCEGASANGIILYVAACTSGYTGGTATARPTATSSDEVVILNSTNWGGVNVDAACKLHVETSTDGQCNRVQIYSGNVCVAFVVIDKPKSPVTGWTNPFVALWLATATAGTNVPLITNCYTTAAAVGRGSASMTMFLTSEAANNLHLNAAQVQAPNDLSAEYYLPQIGLYSNTASNRGQHGYIFDLWWANTVLTEGSGFPATGTTGQFRVVGDFAIPWAGAGTALQII